MKAFICVYQHPIPIRGAWKRTEVAAIDDPHLREFLDRYHEDDFFYDWGDDPAFFAATKQLGNPCTASWGVCRPDVRKQLSVGDFIVWVCARSKTRTHGEIDYFYIGVTTVNEIIDRTSLWKKDAYSRYCSFYNVLAFAGEEGFSQRETFHDYHKDWEHRARAPYILFDANQEVSRVELTNPTRVAVRDPGALQERWLTEDDPLIARIEQTMLLDIGCTRRLRIPSLMNAHRHIPLHKTCPARVDLISLRSKLLRLVSRS
jgi:hypothetical protein